MSDAATTILLSSIVPLVVALVGFIANRLGAKENREDKSRDALQERVEKAEQRAVEADNRALAAEAKTTDTTNRLFTALEDGRQKLLQSDSSCKDQIAQQQTQINALRDELSNIKDFLTVYVRAVRNNTTADVMVKIREEIDAAGVNWPKR